MMSGSPNPTMQGNLLGLATKECRVCKVSKIHSEMVSSKAYSCGIDTICKSCSRERVKNWRIANKDKRAEQIKRESGKPYTINKHLRSLYGITHIHYNEMLAKQNGCCEICGIHHTQLIKRLAVDHCHTTSKIRGLLCQQCNLLLGYAKDSQDILANAISYLKESNDTT